MACDRAGVLSYLNGCGAAGSAGLANCGNAYGRVNDSKLLKKELHYVETYADNHNAEFGGGYNGTGYNNYVNGCGNIGAGGCAPVVGCGPVVGTPACGPCGPIGPGVGPVGPGCGPVGPGCGPIGPGCGPEPGYGPDCYDKPCKCRRREREHCNNSPCGGRDKCYCGGKSKKSKDCDCRSCQRFYRKIYG